MDNAVQLRVKAGQSLITPDGRLIREGEVLAVPAQEAPFFERMGAAEILPANWESDPAVDPAAVDPAAVDPAAVDPAAAKPKKGKTGQQSQQ